MNPSSAKKNFLKVVLIGNANVGKTSLIQTYVKGKNAAQAQATMGSETLKKEIMIDNTLVTLQIWDTAGQEKFSAIGNAFYRGADCCALAFDITDEKSFEDLPKWMNQFIENAVPADPNLFPFMLIGNKVDIEQERKVSNQRARGWANKNSDMPYYETSAREGVLVDEAFVELAKLALKR